MNLEISRRVNYLYLLSFKIVSNVGQTVLMQYLMQMIQHLQDLKIPQMKIFL